jgi:hypothetical protein
MLEVRRGLCGRDGNPTADRKTRRVEAAGSIQGRGKNLGVRDSQKAIPGPLKNPSSPQPPCVRGDPLAVALPDRSAPALR